MITLTPAALCVAANSFLFLTRLPTSCMQVIQGSSCPILTFCNLFPEPVTAIALAVLPLHLHYEMVCKRLWLAQHDAKNFTKPCSDVEGLAAGGVTGRHEAISCPEGGHMNMTDFTLLRLPPALEQQLTGTLSRSLTCSGTHQTLCRHAHSPAARLAQTGPAAG